MYVIVTNGFEKKGLRWRDKIEENLSKLADFIENSPFTFRSLCGFVSNPCRNDICYKDFCDIIEINFKTRHLNVFKQGEKIFSMELCSRKLVGYFLRKPYVIDALGYDRDTMSINKKQGLSLFSIMTELGFYNVSERLNRLTGQCNMVYERIDNDIFLKKVSGEESYHFTVTHSENGKLHTFWWKTVFGDKKICCTREAKYDDVFKSFYKKEKIMFTQTKRYYEVCEKYYKMIQSAKPQEFGGIKMRFHKDINNLAKGCTFFDFVSEIDAMLEKPAVVGVA